MTHRWIHLRFNAPLMSFGDVVIDHLGRTRNFPGLSAITGLCANALGLRREDDDAHQTLQDRIIYGALIVQQGSILTDLQNVRIDKSDTGWTTLGTPETRDGDSYNRPHRRYRDYLMDHDCRVILRLKGDMGEIDTEILAEAFNRPARPLFIGRKPCVPSGPLMVEWIEADDARSALGAIGLAGHGIWPEGEGEAKGTLRNINDVRNWKSMLHSGERMIAEGAIP